MLNFAFEYFQNLLYKLFAPKETEEEKLLFIDRIKELQKRHSSK